MFWWHGEARTLAGDLAYHSSFWWVAFCRCTSITSTAGSTMKFLWLTGSCIRLTFWVRFLPGNLYPLPSNYHLRHSSAIAFNAIPPLIRFRVSAFVVRKSEKRFLVVFRIQRGILCFCACVFFFACFLRLFSMWDCVYIYSVYSSHD